MTAALLPNSELVIRWLRDNPELIRRAAASIDVAEDELADLILVDPPKLVELSQAVVEQANQEVAPAEVTQGLDSWVATMRMGIARLPRYAYTLDRLAELRGMKSPDAIEAALQTAAEGAPDDANRNQLEAMLAAVREMQTAPGEPRPERMSECMVCCVLGFFECAPFGGSMFCCLGGCLICGAF